MQESSERCDSGKQALPEDSDSRPSSADSPLNMGSSSHSSSAYFCLPAPIHSVSAGIRRSRSLMVAASSTCRMSSSSSCAADGDSAPRIMPEGTTGDSVLPVPPLGVAGTSVTMCCMRRSNGLPGWPGAERMPLDPTPAALPGAPISGSG